MGGGSVVRFQRRPRHVTANPGDPPNAKRVRVGTLARRHRQDRPTQSVSFPPAIFGTARAYAQAFDARMSDLRGERRTRPRSKRIGQDCRRLRICPPESLHQPVQAGYRADADALAADGIGPHERRRLSQLIAPILGKPLKAPPTRGFFRSRKCSDRESTLRHRSSHSEVIWTFSTSPRGIFPETSENIAVRWLSGPM